MPAQIRVIEVGPGINSYEEQRRLRAYRRESAFSKAMVSAWLLDTSEATVWTNGPPGQRWFASHSTYQRLLRKPRVAVHTIEALPSAEAAVASSDPAYVTYTLLAVLVAVFGAEYALALGPVTGLLQPSVVTLEALGGLRWTHVVDSDEWYRLLSASFLHADLSHLLLNGFVLVYAGRRLEWIIGHAWFAAIYLISAVFGSIASLAVNPTNLVGVGASGAIMGLLAASVIGSFHFAMGGMRNQLQLTALQMLIPSLLPLWSSTRSGMLIDFGAHVGGAIGGALTAAIMLALWPRSSPVPRFTSFAISLAIVGGMASLATLIPIAGSYAKFQHQHELQALLIPADKFPPTWAEQRKQADSFVSRYPGDPRGYLLRGMNYMDARDHLRAIADFNKGLEQEELLRTALQPDVEMLLRVNLAISLRVIGQTGPAKAAAQPICETNKSGAIRDALNREGLCS
jgi:rhomboid protease GluP